MIVSIFQNTLSPPVVLNCPSSQISGQQTAPGHTHSEHPAWELGVHANPTVRTEHIKLNQMATSDPTPSQRLTLTDQGQAVSDKDTSDPSLCTASREHTCAR